jgi:tungstate transport system substrate-binding protein
MRSLFSLFWLAALAAAGCSRPAQAPSIVLATTTSVQDSGLLDVLVPMFREQSGVEVKVVAVGTGQALQLGRRGDADVLLTHDPDGEKQFVAEGFAVGRRNVAYNDFVLVGPPADPAAVKRMKSAPKAFARIARSRAAFVSRGDDSGTHRKELAQWKLAKIEPAGDWYMLAGAGMGQVLRMANEKRAYTLSDRGTFLALRGGLDLAILGEGDPFLVNQYSVMLVNPEKHPHVRAEDARNFADFLVSPAARKAIETFGIERHGQPLFFPGTAGLVSPER